MEGIMQCARTGTGLFFSVILWRFTRARHQELVPMAGLHGGCIFQFLKITKMFSRVTLITHPHQQHQERLSHPVFPELL